MVGNFDFFEVFESFLGLILVRRTLKKRSQMPAIIISSFAVMTVFYSFFGFFSYMAKGDGNLKQNTFFYYNKTQFLYYVKFLYLPYAAYGVPLIVMFAAENFEDLSSLAWFLKKGGALKRSSILVMRVVFLVVVFVFGFFFENLSKVFDFGGSVCVPLLSYIFPVSFFPIF